MEAQESQTAPKREGALAGEVVVLLEDDDLIRRATERLLRRFGAAIVTASSSAEALAALSARKLTPSWVIADYWLSRQESGLAAAVALRDAAGGPLRGLIVTGDLSRDIAEAVAGSGFRLLRKPVNIDSFLAALTERI